MTFYLFSSIIVSIAITCYLCNAGHKDLNSCLFLVFYADFQLSTICKTPKISTLTPQHSSFLLQLLFLHPFIFFETLLLHLLSFLYNPSIPPHPFHSSIFLPFSTSYPSLYTSSLSSTPYPSLSILSISLHPIHPSTPLPFLLHPLPPSGPFSFSYKYILFLLLHPLPSSVPFSFSYKYTAFLLLHPLPPSVPFLFPLQLHSFPSFTLPFLYSFFLSCHFLFLFFEFQISIFRLYR